MYPAGPPSLRAVSSSYFRKSRQTDKRTVAKVYYRSTLHTFSSRGPTETLVQLDTVWTIARPVARPLALAVPGSARQVALVTQILARATFMLRHMRAQTEVTVLALAAQLAFAVFTSPPDAHTLLERAFIHHLVGGRRPRATLWPGTTHSLPKNRGPADGTTLLPRTKAFRLFGRGPRTPLDGAENG